MGLITCQYCGEKIERDSKFCYNCGSTVANEKSGKKGEKRPVIEDIYSHAMDEEQPARANRSRTRNSRKRRITTGVIITFVLMASIGVIVPVVLVSVYGPFSYNHLGSTSYSSDTLVLPNASLVVQNAQGEIMIEYDDTQLEALTATIEVYGRSEANITEAKEFVVSNSSGTTEFLFKAIDTTNWLDKTAMVYDLYITLNPTVDFAIDIEAFSGDTIIDFTEGDNANITGFTIASFSGDINIDLGDEKIITLPKFELSAGSGDIDMVIGTNIAIDTTTFSLTSFSGDIMVDVTSYFTLIADTVFIQASSGNINLDYGSDATILTDEYTIDLFSGDFYSNTGYEFTLNASEISILASSGNIDFILGTDAILTAESFTIDAFSGDTQLDFGHSAELNILDITIESSSGNVVIELDETIFTDDIEWDIDAFSGDITLFLEPAYIPGINYTAEFLIHASSGNIDILYDLNEAEIGLEIEASVTSGDIHMPGGHDYYISQNYALRAAQYHLDLSTFSGDIDVMD